MNAYEFRSGDVVVLTLDGQPEQYAMIIRPFKGYVQVQITRPDGSTQKLIVLPRQLREGTLENTDADHSNAE